MLIGAQIIDMMLLVIDITKVLLSKIFNAIKENNIIQMLLSLAMENVYFSSGNANTNSRMLSYWRNYL